MAEQCQAHFFHIINFIFNIQIKPLSGLEKYREDGSIAPIKGSCQEGRKQLKEEKLMSVVTTIYSRICISNIGRKLSALLPGSKTTFQDMVLILIYLVTYLLVMYVINIQGPPTPLGCAIRLG